MKKVGVLLFAFIFLFSMTVLPALAADTSKEVQQLKGEVQKTSQEDRRAGEEADRDCYQGCRSREKGGKGRKEVSERPY